MCLRNCLSVCAVVSLLFMGCARIQSPEKEAQGVPTSLSSLDSSSFATGSDWKTYNNEKYGITFRYPSEWVIESHEDVIELMITVENKLLSDWNKTHDTRGKPRGAQFVDFQVGKEKDSKKDFVSFGRELEFYGQRCPADEIDPITINGIRGWDYRHCNQWDYVLEQDPSHFTWIWHGDDVVGSSDVDKIIRSIHFSEPLR
ncbi:MAG: PsbP-related protein [Candidatus Peregrinibacteria bacterium]